MKRRLLVLLSVSALAGLGACSSSSTTTATSTTANQPTTSTPAAPSVGSTASGAVIGARMVDAMTKAGSGKAVISSEGATGAGALTGDVAYTIAKDGSIASKGTVNVAGQSMEVISTGGMFYLKSAMVKASNGAPWVKIDPNGTDPLSKQLAPTLKSSADPRTQIEALKSSTATFVGTEGGLSHYKLSGLGGATVGAADVDVWLDSQDRPTKTTVTASGAKISSTYTDWGTPVTIAPPPADQVGTLALG